MTAAVDHGAVLILISLLAIPFAALTFSRAGEVYRAIDKGTLTLGGELPLPRYLRPPAQPLDPAIQAAEVRQMLEAKAGHRRRRGGDPLDVDVEADRLLGSPAAATTQEETLRSEVRNLVIARNERRMRRGIEPLNVEAETRRQLEDFVGSP